VLWPKLGLRGPIYQADRPARVVRRPIFVAALTLIIGYLMHRPSLTRWQSRIWKGANTWLAGQGGGAGWLHFGSVGPGLCATSSTCVTFSVTMPYFGHMEDMHGFWSIWCFSLFNVPQMIDQQNSWNSLVISTYFLYLEWNVGMLVVNIRILWLPTCTQRPVGGHLAWRCGEAIDVSYATPQPHRIVNVALHQEYSPGIVFIFSQRRKDLFHV
jgi:hypothetical protein